MEDQNKNALQEGTVTSYESCPHCKSPHTVIMQTMVTGEQVAACGACGYSFVRKVVTDGKTGKPLLTIDNKFNYVTETVDKPFGALHIVALDDQVDFYAIPDQAHFDEHVVPYIDQHRLDIKEVTLSRFVGGEIVRTDLLKQSDDVNTRQEPSNDHPEAGEHAL